MHFTYKRPEDDLQQGDLLKVSDELRQVLQQFHPHYANNSDYHYLMVLTKTVTFSAATEDAKPDT